MFKRFNHQLQSTEGVILCTIIRDVHQFIGHCHIPLDPCDFFTSKTTEVQSCICTQNTFIICNFKKTKYFILCFDIYFCFSSPQKSAIAKVRFSAKKWAELFFSSEATQQFTLSVPSVCQSVMLLGKFYFLVCYQPCDVIKMRDYPSLFRFFSYFPPSPLFL